MHAVETVRETGSKAVLGMLFKKGHGRNSEYQKLFISCTHNTAKWIKEAQITSTERLLLDKTSAPFDGRFLTLNNTEFKNLLKDGTFDEIVGGSETVTYHSQREVPGYGIKLHLKKHMRLTKDMQKNAMLAARLRHFAIAPVYAVFQDHPERISFVSACFKLENLRTLLDSGELEYIERFRIIYHISCAIDFLHTPVKNGTTYRNALLHLDISSANIVLDNNHNARLIDSSQELPAERGVPNKDSTPLGRTTGYFPDGVCDHVDNHLDYFSFGVVIRELITGENPATKCGHCKTFLKSEKLCVHLNAQLYVWQYVDQCNEEKVVREELVEEIVENCMTVGTSDISSVMDKLVVAVRAMQILHDLNSTEKPLQNEHSFKIVKTVINSIKSKKIRTDCLLPWLKDINEGLKRRKVTKMDRLKYISKMTFACNQKKNSCHDLLRDLQFDKNECEEEWKELNECPEKKIDQHIIYRVSVVVAKTYLNMKYITFDLTCENVVDCLNDMATLCLRTKDNFNFKLDIKTKLKARLHSENIPKWNSGTISGSNLTKRIQTKPENKVPAISCDVCLLNEAAKVKNIVRHESNCKGINLCITCIKNHYFNPLCCPMCNACQPDIGGNGVRFLCVSGADNDPEKSKLFKRNAQKIEGVFSSKVHQTLCISKIQTLHASESKEQLDAIKRAILQPTEPTKPTVPTKPTEPTKPKRYKTLVLYYCGHGEKSSLNVTDNFAITQDDLNTLAERYSASKLIAVLDCCYAPEIKNDKQGITILQINSSEQDKTKPANSQFTDALTKALFKSHDIDNVPQFDPTVEVINMPELETRTNLCQRAAYIHAKTSNQNVSFCSVPYVHIQVLRTKVENYKIMIYWHANWKKVLKQVQSVYVFETDWLHEQCKDAIILRNDIDTSGKEIGTLKDLWKALEQKRPLSVDLRRIHDYNKGSPKRIVIYESDGIPSGIRYTSSQIKILRDLNAEKRNTEETKEPVVQYTKVEVMGMDVIPIIKGRYSSDNASLKHEDDEKAEMQDQHKCAVGRMLQKILNYEELETISTLRLEFYFEREGCSSGEHRLGLVMGSSSAHGTQLKKALKPSNH